MKLQTRLTIVSAAVITIVSLAIGGFAIVTTQNLEITRIDKILNNVLFQLQGNEIDPFSEAIYIAETSEIALALGYVGPGGELSILDDSQDVLKSNPSNRELLSGLTKPTTFGDPKIRFRTFQVSDTEYLLIGTSIASIQTALTQKILFLLLFIFVAILLARLVWPKRWICCRWRPRLSATIPG